MRTLVTCDTLSCAFSVMASMFIWGAIPMRLSQADQPQPIGTRLQPFVERHALAGAVLLVADKNRTLDLETVGYSDVSAAKPMAPDSLFWIASMSKPMTATAVMMLVDEGKIALDDPVEKYLSEFAGQQVSVQGPDGQTALVDPVHPMTIRNVLSHTSGLPFSSPSETPTLDVGTLESRVESYAALPLDFQPGSRWQYSNAGINTAARVLEVVSGMPYEDFMQQRLFDPLGMPDTTFWPNKDQLQRLAQAYKPTDNGDDLQATGITQLRYPLDDRTHRFPMPAGGLFSTARDVARFCQMLLNEGQLNGRRYLSAEAIREMSRKQTAADVSDSYGLGWAVGDGWFGHGGAYSTNMTIDCRHGLVTVYMVHHAGFPKDGATCGDLFRRLATEQFAVRSDAEK